MNDFLDAVSKAIGSIYTIVSLVEKLDAFLEKKGSSTESESKDEPKA